MNKKGDAEGIGMVFSIVFLILILSLFWLFSFIDEGVVREETSNQIDLSNININLLNLLRTEVDDSTVADLIVESYSKDDYSKLTTEVNNIFQTYFDQDFCWTLLVLEVDSIISDVHNVCGGRELISQVNLPTLDSKELTIKLARYGAEKTVPTYKGGSNG